MKWGKRGLIYAPGKKVWWNQLYAIIPTPVYIAEKNIIRIYFSTTCSDKYGRVTFVDVDADDPSIVVYQHKDYVLDTGEPGTFDDCGVNVTSVLQKDGRYLLYYAGYQRHYRVPYSILTGLAFSKDGLNFERASKVPLWERTNEELNIRSAPTVVAENGILKAWYVAGKDWSKMEDGVHKGKLMPIYELKYAESVDGVNWEFLQGPVFELEDDEFGFGRPYIFRKNEVYQLFYSIRRVNKSYRIGYAESLDGKNWVRKDDEVGIDVSESGWDSEMICYPAIVEVKGRTYMFYNGNNNGETGFGYAVQIEE